MGARMRCQHDTLLQIGFTQRAACGLLQVEVGQPVVDQVNGQIAMPQQAVAKFERRWAGDDRAQPVLAEQQLKKKELMVKVLRLRCLVNDGDARQRSGAASQTPFFVELSTMCCSKAFTLGAIASIAVQQARCACVRPVASGHHQHGLGVNCCLCVVTWLKTPHAEYLWTCNSTADTFSSPAAAGRRCRCNDRP